MELVRDKIVNIGTIKAGTSKNLVIWECLEGQVDKVEHLTASCGCTTPTTQGNNIIAYYNDSSDKSVINSTPNKLITVTKTVTAYIKDGRPLKTPNGKGVLDWNPDKEKVILKFFATVE